MLPLRVLCAFTTVAGGGSERFLVEFVRAADRRRLSPEVALLYAGGLDYELDPAPVHYLLPGPWQEKPLLRLRDRVLGTIALARCMGKFDAVVSFGSLFNGCVALAAWLSRFGGPVILIESIHQSSAGPRAPALAFMRRMYVRLTYGLATRVVAVAEGTERDLRHAFGLGRNLSIIHYGLDQAEIRRKAALPLEHAWLEGTSRPMVLVAVGRLAEQKGFSYLITAMSRLPDYVRLVLVGEGPLRGSLEALARSLGISERIWFAGYDRNPYRYMARADIFVLPSLFEGLPLVLIEALALGLPIIAADCPSGPAELLDGGRYGRLIPTRDAAALAASITQLVGDPAERDRLAAAARERATAFRVETALGAYEALLHQRQAHHARQDQVGVVR